MNALWQSQDRLDRIDERLDKYVEELTKHVAACDERSKQMLFNQDRVQAQLRELANTQKEQHAENQGAVADARRQLRGIDNIKWWVMGVGAAFAFLYTDAHSFVADLLKVIH